MFVRYLIAPAVAVLTTLASAAELKTSDTSPAPVAAGVRLSHCLVSLIDDIEIPAEKPGVLTSLAAREGAYLEAQAPIASIDEEQAVLQHETAQAEADAARAKADNPLEIEYAIATHRTAEAEYKISLNANLKQPNSVSAVELERCSHHVDGDGKHPRADDGGCGLVRRATHYCVYGRSAGRCR